MRLLETIKTQDVQQGEKNIMVRTLNTSGHMILLEL